MAIVNIYFEDEQQTVQAEAGRSLSEICDQYSSSLLFGCREAACGTCLIEVLSGLEHLSPVTDDEQDLLDVLSPDNPCARLACQCVVLGDIRLVALKS